MPHLLRRAHEAEAPRHRQRDGFDAFRGQVHVEGVVEVGAHFLEDVLDGRAGPAQAQMRPGPPVHLVVAGGHHAAPRLGQLHVVGDDGMEVAGHPQRGGIAPRLPRARAELVIAPLDQRGVGADADHHAVRRPPRHPEGPGTATGDDDRHRARVLQSRRRGPAQREALAGEHAAYHPHRRLLLREAGGAQAHLEHGGVTRTDAEQDATRRVEIHGGDAGGEHRGMTRDRVDEERADPGALGAARGGEQVDEDVAGAELAVGEPEMGEAGRFGLAAALGQPRGIGEAEAVGAEGERLGHAGPVRRDAAGASDPASPRGRTSRAARPRARRCGRRSSPAAPGGDWRAGAPSDSRRSRPARC